MAAMRRIAIPGDRRSLLAHSLRTSVHEKTGSNNPKLSDKAFV